jgi:hypothetical protein
MSAWSNDMLCAVESCHIELTAIWVRTAGLTAGASRANQNQLRRALCFLSAPYFRRGNQRAVETRYSDYSGGRDGSCDKHAQIGDLAGATRSCESANGSPPSQSDRQPSL